MENIGYYYWREYFQGLNSLKVNEWQEEKKKAETLKKKRDRLKDFVYCREEGAENLLSVRHSVGFCLKTLYPGLLTGVGLPHEVPEKNALKLGFYFDYTTGLPVIPGSTCKGMLRSAFPQWDKHTQEPDKIKMAKTEYIYRIIENKEKETELKIGNREREQVAFIENEIFEGRVDERQLPVYSRDVFFDAYVLRGILDSTHSGCLLGMDYITPHYKDDVFSEKSLLKNPEPIPFVKILPDVVFQFQFQLNNNNKYVDPKDFRKRLLKVDEKIKLFKKIFLDFGIGAKTNVGYGQFQEVVSGFNCQCGK